MKSKLFGLEMVVTEVEARVNWEETISMLVSETEIPWMEESEMDRVDTNALNKVVSLWIWVLFWTERDARISWKIALAGTSLIRAS